MMGIFVRIFAQAVVWGAGARIGCALGRKLANELGIADRTDEPDGVEGAEGAEGAVDEGSPGHGMGQPA